MTINEIRNETERFSYLELSKVHGETVPVFHSEDGLRTVFENSGWVDTEENFELWLKVNTDASINPNCKYAVLLNGKVVGEKPKWLTEIENEIDSYGLIKSNQAWSILDAMSANVDLMDEDEKACDATFTITFNSPFGKQELELPWCSQAYDIIETTIYEILNTDC